MYRDRDEELQRLQEQLLEEEEPEEQAAEETEELLDEDTLDAWLDGQQPKDSRIYQNFSNDYGRNLRNYASGYKAYNTDHTDTDLESYSEAVREPKKSGGLLWLAVVLLGLAAAVVGCILWIYLGLGGLF